MNKNLTVGALHLLFSPINRAWLILWGSRDITECQTLRVFTDYDKAKIEFERISGC